MFIWIRIKQITKLFKTISKIVCFGVLILGAGLVYAQEFWGADKGYMSLALDAIERGDYSQAKIYLQKAWELDPGNKQIEEFLEKIKYLQEVRSAKQLAVRGAGGQFFSSQRDGSKDKLMEQVLKEEEMKKALLEQEVLIVESRYISSFGKASKKPKKLKTSKPKKAERSELVMERVLLKWEKKVKSKVKPVQVKFKEQEIQVTEADRSKFINLDVEIGYPVVVRFPNIIKSVVIVDKDLVSAKKIGDYQLEISANAKKLGSGVVYVWDKVGMWMFNIKTHPPKKKIEKQLRLAKKKKKMQEDILFSYDSYWSGFYRGGSFGDLDRSSLSFTQSFSLKGPTTYGRLSSQISVAKLDSSYKANYKFVSLDDINRFGFKDGRVVLGDFFTGLSDFSFPGNSLEGFLVSENRKKYSVTAFYGSPINYWGYVPVIGGSDKPIAGFKLENENLSLNIAYKHEQSNNLTDERLVSDKVVSLQLHKYRKNSWNLVGEFAFDDDSNFAGVLDIDKTFKKWWWHLNLRGVDPGYRTVSGVPVYSGELGGKLEFSYDIGKARRISSFVNVYRDRSYFGLANRLNLDYELQYSRAKEKSSYKVKFNYYSRAVLGGRIDTYLLQAYYNRGSVLFKRPIQWRYGFSYSQNKDNAFSQDISVARASFGVSWELIKRWLSVYTDCEIGKVMDHKRGQSAWPYIAEFGYRFSHRFGRNRWFWYFSGSYRMESGGDMPYSFVSNRDLFSLRAKLQYELSSDKNMYIQANLKKYYPKDSSAFAEGEIYMGLSWIWDTGINLLPKIFVYGKVFEDVNMNGKQDPGEKGLAGVRVVCEDRSAKTDADGKYVIGWIKSDKASVSIVLSDLPAGMFPARNKVALIPSNGKKQHIDFPVSYQCGIQIYAFIDTNNNKKLDLADKPLEGVRVCIGDRCRFTDNAGAIVIDRLQPGQYELSLDLTTLPENSIPTVPVVQKVVVLQGKMKRVFLPILQIENKDKK